MASTLRTITPVNGSLYVERGQKFRARLHVVRPWLRPYDAAQVLPFENRSLSRIILGLFRIDYRSQQEKLNQQITKPQIHWLCFH